MNTASHHRVHHGINPRYLDRNHAGVFIVWDRFFGTFEPEGEAAVYGVVTPIRSMNPLWANFEYFATLFGIARATGAWRDKVRVFFASPAWRPADLGGPKAAPAVTPETFVKYDPQPSRGLPAYIVAWFVVVGAAITALMPLALTMAATPLVVCAALLLWTLLSWGGLLERRAWARPAEWLRHAALAGCLVAWQFGALDGFLSPLPGLAAGIAGAGLLVSALAFAVLPSLGDLPALARQPAKG